MSEEKKFTPSSNIPLLSNRKVGKKIHNPKVSQVLLGVAILQPMVVAHCFIIFQV